jgi:hypothetical protein
MMLPLSNRENREAVIFRRQKLIPCPQRYCLREVKSLLVIPKQHPISSALFKGVELSKFPITSVFLVEII